MLKFKEFTLTQVRKKWWILLILVLLIMILPSRQTLSDDFKIYDYLAFREEEYTLQFDIAITKNHNIPFLSKKPNVHFQSNDRIYRYMTLNFLNREDLYIPLYTGIFDFGVILPNDNFSEFVILFDENHHFKDSHNVKFAVYSQRNKTEAIILLNNLLEKTGYDMTSRPIH